MLRKQTITVMVRLNRSPEMGKLAEGKAFYHQHRATPDERRGVPKAEAPAGRNPIPANAVRMTPFQGFGCCPFTLRRAMPDAIDTKGFQPSFSTSIKSLTGFTIPPVKHHKELTF
jgi:hypothetical protein